MKKSKRKVQGVPQLQTAALPRHQEEGETDKSKQAQIEQLYEKHYDLNYREVQSTFTASQLHPGPDATLNTDIHKNSVRIKAPNSVNASNRKHENQINYYNKERRVLMAKSMYAGVNENQ